MYADIRPFQLPIPAEVAKKRAKSISKRFDDCYCRKGIIQTKVQK